MRYRAPDGHALLRADLDAFTAIFHRPSGITHLLTSPAPEILALLADAAMDVPTLLARLESEYELPDAARDALEARVAELVAAGLLARA